MDRLTTLRDYIVYLKSNCRGVEIIAEITFSSLVNCDGMV